MEGNVVWTLTRSVNNLFTGREDILENIENSLRRSLNDTTSDFQRRFIITGMGGQGKSEICLKVANSLRQWYVCISLRLQVRH